MAYETEDNNICCYPDRRDVSVDLCLAEGMRAVMYILNPVKVIEVQKNVWLWFVLKLDFTLVDHFIAGLVAGFVFGRLAGYAVATTKEITDGIGNEDCVGINKCKQGFDGFDFAAGILGTEAGVLIRNFIKG